MSVFQEQNYNIAQSLVTFILCFISLYLWHYLQNCTFLLNTYLKLVINKVKNHFVNHLFNYSIVNETKISFNISEYDMFRPRFLCTYKASL